MPNERIVKKMKKLLWAMPFILMMMLIFVGNSSNAHSLGVEASFIPSGSGRSVVVLVLGALNLV